MQKWQDGELPSNAIAPHLDNCLACHGCETVCPSGVQYGRILTTARETLAREDHSLSRRLKRFVFRLILPNAALLDLGGGLLRLYQRTGAQAFMRRSGLLRLVPGLAAQEALLPTVPARRPLRAGDVFGDPAGERVVLPVGCVMDVFYNPVHWDTIDVLVANGYRVYIPERTCCGALAHHAGDLDIARRLARSTVDALLAPEPRWIALNSAGCGSSMKEAPHLLADDPAMAEKARRFADKIVDITELLAQKPLMPFKRPINRRVTYHAACHLYHAQGVKTQPVDLLAQIPDLTLVPLENAEACCGSAGIYNIEHPALAGEILAAKMDTIRAACREEGVDTVVTGNPGCLLQIEKGAREAGLSLRVRHPVSVLADAYREEERP
jgi:glycolate oxidase iron-sulfur subunit